MELRMAKSSLPIYQGGKNSIMWSAQPREVLFGLLYKLGDLPPYRDWNGAMDPSVEGYIGKQYSDVFLQQVADEMNLLCVSYLLRSPDRRRWQDQRYTKTNVLQQIRFATQQGLRGKGYQHRFDGQRQSCLGNLQAAINAGFMDFSDIHPGMHPFLATAHPSVSTWYPKMTASEVEQVLSPELITEKAKEVLNIAATEKESEEMSNNNVDAERNLVMATLTEGERFILDSIGAVLSVAVECNDLFVYDMNTEGRLDKDDIYDLLENAVTSCIIDAGDEFPTLSQTLANVPFRRELAALAS
jgi:hypothetical protein